MNQGSPYPECLELRKQHRDPSAETAAGAVLFNVKVLQSWDFRRNRVHVFQCYGYSQRQPGHTGWDGGGIGSERISTYKDRKQHQELRRNLDFG